MQQREALGKGREVGRVPDPRFHGDDDCADATSRPFPIRHTVKGTLTSGTTTFCPLISAMNFEASGSITPNVP
jgi:hypothetical protein